MIPAEALEFARRMVDRSICCKCHARLSDGGHLIITERNQLTAENIKKLAPGEMLDLGTFKVLCDECYSCQESGL